MQKKNPSRGSYNHALHIYKHRSDFFSVTVSGPFLYARHSNSTGKTLPSPVAFRNYCKTSQTWAPAGWSAFSNRYPSQSAVLQIALPCTANAWSVKNSTRAGGWPPIIQTQPHRWENPFIRYWSEVFSSLKRILHGLPIPGDPIAVRLWVPRTFLYHL